MVGGIQNEMPPQAFLVAYGGKVTVLKNKKTGTYQVRRTRYG